MTNIYAMEEDSMKMTLNREGDHLELRLAESIECACVQDAKRTLGPILEMGRDMVVDLSDVDAVDTSAVQLLILFKREAERRGLGCNFVRPAPRVAEKLELFRLPGLVSGVVAHV